MRGFRASQSKNLRFVRATPASRVVDVDIVVILHGEFRANVSNQKTVSAQ
jgi:hypothetical protein